MVAAVRLPGDTVNRKLEWHEGVQGERKKEKKCRRQQAPEQAKAMPTSGRTGGRDDVSERALHGDSERG
jgi:hypothetical protein